MGNNNSLMKHNKNVNILLKNNDDIQNLKKELETIKLSLIKQEEMIIDLLQKKDNKNKKDYNNIHTFYLEGLEDALILFFSKHKPKIIPKIEKMLEKYKGKEKYLLKEIERKYGEKVDWEPKINYENMIFIK
tara:strand:+ start:348 stop:743 length:396 start_codon:yes stop_codon:yes gene_type:complete